MKNKTPQELGKELVESSAIAVAVKREADGFKRSVVHIPEDNAVLFLSEEDKEQYLSLYENNICCFSIKELETWELKFLNDSGEMEIPKKATIFLPHGTLSEFQKAEEVEKELREKYGVEEVNLFALHCFEYICITTGPLKQMRIENMGFDTNFNKIITTNSTGMSKPKDSERLQVIDCKEFFEEHLNQKS